MRSNLRLVLIALACSGLGCSTPRSAAAPSQLPLLEPAASDVPYDVQNCTTCPRKRRASGAKSTRVSWWLQPSKRFEEGGDVVTEGGRVVGTVEHRSQQLQHGGEIDPAHTRISVRVYDDAGRAVGEWIFRDADLGEGAATPMELRADITYDPSDDVWRYTGDDARLEQVWLGQYDDASERVSRDALWRRVDTPAVPGIDSTFSQLGTDEPHKIRKFSGAYTAAVPMPEEWRGKLWMAALRTVDEQGRLTRYAQYKNRWHEDPSKQRLTLERSFTREWAGGRLVREARDDRSRGRDPNLADGIVDSVSEQIVEDGRVVETRTRRVGFEPHVSWAQVPPRWRSVEVESDADGEWVEPRSFVSRRASYLRDDAGNLRERRSQKRRTVVLYEYDDQGRRTWSGQDGRARPGQLVATTNRPHIRKMDGLFDRTTRFKYDEQGRRSTKVTTKYEQGIQTRRYVTTYQYEDGRLVGERRSSRSPSRPDFKGRARVVKYQYDDVGRLVLRIEGWEGAGRPFSTTLFDYDEAGRLSRKTDLGSGRHELEDVSGEPEMFSKRREYTRDSRGRVVEERVYRRGLETPSYRIEYVYGRDDRPVRTLHFTGKRKRGTFDWEMTFRFVRHYKYDGQGRLVREVDTGATRVVRYPQRCFDEDARDDGALGR
jgi:hypothetical protein